MDCNTNIFCTGGGCHLFMKYFFSRLSFTGWCAAIELVELGTSAGNCFETFFVHTSSVCVWRNRPDLVRMWNISKEAAVNEKAAREILTSFMHLKPKSDTNSEQKLLFDSGATAAGVHSGTHSSSPKKHSGRPSHFRAMMKRKVPSMLKHFRRDSSAWVRITIFGYLPPPGNTNNLSIIRNVRWTFRDVNKVFRWRRN